MITPIPCSACTPNDALMSDSHCLPDVLILLIAAVAIVPVFRRLRAIAGEDRAGTG